MSGPPWPQVSRPQAMLRGLARRCARCGSAGLFEGWFEMMPHCPRCDLDFERNPGAFIGGIGLNTSVTVIGLVLALLFSLIFIDGTWGVVPLLAVAVVVPVVFFGTSKTLWVAFEYLVTPPDPRE